MNVRQRADQSFGRGVVQLDLSTADLLLIDPGSLREELLAAITTQSASLPTLPATALEVLELSGRPNVGHAELVAVLGHDPMLAAQTLRRAQSAAYAGAPARTLLEAAQRLGTSGLRDLVLETALSRRVFKVPRYAESAELLRRHSSALALAARMTAQYTAFAFDYAFLCGLLADIGSAVLLMLLGDRKKKEPPPPALIEPVIAGLHQEAGERICRAWKLPEEICLLVGAHHRGTIGGVGHPMLAVLSFAEELLIGAGISPGFARPEGSQPAPQAIGLTPAIAAKITRDLRRALG
jgi:HD-like signal output (HDOD) protein